MASYKTPGRVPVYNGLNAVFKMSKYFQKLRSVGATASIGIGNRQSLFKCRVGRNVGRCISVGFWTQIKGRLRQAFTRWRALSSRCDLATNARSSSFDNNMRGWSNV
ncbi:unnamed protein product [Colias eurytheme]|nr:unnamed protein product [Colias eurytheme]